MSERKNDVAFQGIQKWLPVVAVLLTSIGNTFAEDTVEKQMIWWNNPSSSQVRKTGETLASDPKTASLGHLMLSRYAEAGEGNLPKALHEARLAVACPQDDPAVKLLLRFQLTETLQALGQHNDEEVALDEYGRFWNPEIGERYHLQSPELMRVYLDESLGKFPEAKEILSKIPDAESSEGVARQGLAKAELESLLGRDAKKPADVIDKTRDLMGESEFSKNYDLLNTAAFYKANQFLMEDAQALYVQATHLKQRPINTLELPEGEIAEGLLMDCRWQEAADWIEKAQVAKMTLLPNYRQEAQKFLQFTIADFYLATGYTQKARLALEGLEDDFFRAGYTTEVGSYYRLGLYLRRSLALRRELELADAGWWVSDLNKKVHVLPALITLRIELLQATMKFREALRDRVDHSAPGVDIASLCFAPAWLLPAMREILGRAEFAKLAESFRPEGSRQEVLGPLLDLLSHRSISRGSKVPNISQPQLLSAICSALTAQSSESIASAYNAAPSAYLLIGRALPVDPLVANIRISGWMKSSPVGMRIRMEGSDSEKLVSVSGSSDITLRTFQLEKPKSEAGQLEMVNQALLASLYPLSDLQINKIEGRALSFRNGK